MNKLPTAEQFFLNKAKELNSDPDDIPEWMIDAAIEFAKLHVDTALNAGAKKLTDKLLEYQKNKSTEMVSIKRTILSAYPETNIK